MDDTALLHLVVVAMVILSDVTKATIDDDKLIMVHVLYRHGARSPRIIYPTDPNMESMWPDGTKRLTQAGMRGEYEIGQFLKARYVNTKFISQPYLHKEVMIRSSGEDRCLQSAEAQLAGLYPPKGWQIWNKKLLWQPIPIQTVPMDDDPLLRPDQTKNCPEHQNLLHRMRKNSAEFQQKLKDNAELIEYMQDNSGFGKLLTYNNFWVIWECTVSELAQGMTPPKWVMDRYKEITDLTFYLRMFKYKGTGEDGDLLARITGGTLLGKMVDNMKSMSSDDSKTKQNLVKMNIFSAHDSTMYGFAHALSIEHYFTELIPYSAIILVELFKNKTGDYYVKMTYRHNGILSPWKLPGCNYNCTLDVFIELTKKRVTTDRPKDCKALPQPTFFTYDELNIISIVMLCVVIIFFIIIVILLRRLYVASGSSKKYGETQNKNDDEKKSLIPP